MKTIMNNLEDSSASTYCTVLIISYVKLMYNLNLRNIGVRNLTTKISDMQGPNL